MLDPAHIAPSRSDANSNGHFPPANGHMPAGTPRGFNLQNFGAMNGMPAMPGFGSTGGFPQFFGGHTIQSPLGWVGNDNRGAGPIRRGGRQYQANNARSGPYDRQPRIQRWGSETGRLSPPLGVRRGGMAGGGRWGDGAAGSAAVGPPQAVQGRSIKSYEDLDAVAGAGSGELNY